MDVPPSATTLGLPDNDRIRILAVTVARAGPRTLPARVAQGE